jgi:hypothetical protein
MIKGRTMKKTVKTRKSKHFQNIIAKVMKNNSNTNIQGDMSFAEIQAKRDETLDHLYNQQKQTKICSRYSRNTTPKLQGIRFCNQAYCSSCWAFAIND